MMMMRRRRKVRRRMGTVYRPLEGTNILGLVDRAG